MSIVRLGLIIVALLLLASVAGFGQSTIRGVVSDSLTGEVLVGANVVVQGTALGGTTNLEGKFTIVRVPAGSYKIRASYIGYTAKVLVVRVTGADMSVNFPLGPEVVQGVEVVVTGQMKGQVAAINQQLTANKIVNVVSEEKIQELPDANAAEAIGRLPGVSITRSGGEANRIILRGLSDRFGSITVDGMKMASTDVNTRGVDLSTVSQGSLAGIELFKSITSDMDADAIAGTVNLVTKKAPAERLVRVDAKGAYNKLAKTAKQYDFELRYGERYFKDLVGLQLSGNVERRDRSQEDYSTPWDYLHRNDAYWQNGLYGITQLFVDYTDEIRKRGGFSAIADINTPDNGNIKFSNVFNSTNRNFITYSRSYPDTSTIPSYGARDQEINVDTYNGFLKGENNLLGLNANWGMGFAQSKETHPYDLQMIFQEQNGMTAIPGNLQKGPAELWSQYAVNDFGPASTTSWLYQAYFRGQENLERNRVAFLDLSRDYQLGNSMSGAFKFGGKYFQRLRFKEQSEAFAPYYLAGYFGFTRLPDGTIVPKNLAGTQFANLRTSGGTSPLVFTSNFLDPNALNRTVLGKFSLTPLVSRSAMEDWYAINKDGVKDLSASQPEFWNNFATEIDGYDITERVGALYAMNTLNLGQDVTMIAGVRAERESNDYKTKFSPEDLTGTVGAPAGNVQDTSAAYHETVWLPNLQLTLRPTEYLTVRLAAYRALARPDFNARLPLFISAQATTFYPGPSAIASNSNLRAAKAWNFELGNSFHASGIGLFTVSGFYKVISDMYHQLNGATVSGTAAHTQAILDSIATVYGLRLKPITFGQAAPRYTLTFPYNSNRPTKLWGFEIEHQADFRWLPGYLKNIVLNYNFSIVRSEAYVFQTVNPVPVDTVRRFPVLVTRQRTEFFDQKVKLEGQPEFYGNVALGYDIAGFSARVSVFFMGEYTLFYSGTRESDPIVNGFQKWDLTLKQNVNDHVALTFALNNFTGIEESQNLRDNVTGWNNISTSSFYGLGADLGVRITL